MADGTRVNFVNLNVEAETAFGVENGAHTWIEVPVIQGSLPTAFQKEALANDTVRNDDGHNDPIAGSKAGQELPFETYLFGLGTAAGDMTTPTPSVLDVPLTATIAAPVSFDGDLTTGTISTTAFDLTAQSALTISGPVVMGVTTPTMGVQWVPVTITSGAVACLIELPEVPAGGAVVYGTVNYQWDVAVVEGNSFQAQTLTDDAAHKYLTLGCLGGSLTVNMTARQLGKIAFNAMMIDWEDAETDPLVSVTPPLVRPWMDSHALISDFGDTTRTAYAVKGELAVQAERSLQLRDDPNATQGASMHDSVGDPAITVDVQLPASDAWRDEFGQENDPHYHALFACSRVAGRSSGVYLPEMVQIAWPEDTEQAGIKTTTAHFGAATGQSVRMVFYQG